MLFVYPVCLRGTLHRNICRVTLANLAQWEPLPEQAQPDKQAHTYVSLPATLVQAWSAINLCIPEEYVGRFA